MKREILAEAKRREAAPEVIAELEKGSPEKAKRWAKANDLPSRWHPGRGHTDPPQPEADPPRAEEGQIPAAGRAAGGDLGGGGRHRAGEGAHRPAPAAAPAALPEPVSGYGSGKGDLYDAQWSTQQLQKQIAQISSEQGKHRDEASLLAGVKTQISPVGGGTNTTRKVVLDNGIEGYHKPFSGVESQLARDFGQTSAQQPIHEVAAWQVARELGPPWESIVPPVVLREVDGEMGSFALERPGVQMKMPNDIDPGEAKAAAFFDCLVGQQDRHPNNYLVQGDRVNLIDHGYTFAQGSDYMNWSFFHQSRYRAGGRDSLLTGAEVDALDRFLDSPNSWGLEGVLEPSRLEAMRSRALQMRATGRILPTDKYSW